MSEGTRILIAEDDPVFRKLLERILRKWGYDVMVTKDGDEAWDALQKEDVHLIILDWMMPGMNGVQICREIRQQERKYYPYIILLTVRDRKEDIVEGMAAGADDYIAKPFDNQELEVRLRAGRRILDLQAALVAAQEKLQEQATHDMLTGLWNRSAIFDILERELARTRRQESSLGVIIADLDHFKRVNDTYGHIAGDAVLREAAARMASSLRPYDSIGRYGGEEFLCVVPGCDGPNGVQVGERIRAHVAAEPIPTSEGMVPLTVSLGVATNAGFEDKGGDALLRAADAALYRAKNRGRNRIELATREDMTDGQ